MSGIEIFGIVLGLYPIVVTLAQAYSAAKPGVGSKQLSRKLETEATIYEKIVKDLLTSVASQEEIQRLVELRTDVPEPWEEQNLRRKLRLRLGGEKLELTRAHLDEARETLEFLRSELTNMYRGTRVLDRFKTKMKATMANMPQSSIKNHLTRLNELNKDLIRLLDETPVLTPFPQHRTEVTVFHQYHSGEALEFYEAIKQIYTCACSTAHLANVGCHCDSCMRPLAPLESEASAQGWSFGLAFPRRQDSQSYPPLLSTSVTLEPFNLTEDMINRPELLKRTMVSPESFSELSAKTIAQEDLDVERLIIQDLCSLIKDVEGGSRDSNVLMDIVGNNKTYQLKVKKLDENRLESFRYFADFIKPKHRLSPKSRMELAFRLSSAILQLSKTPWISESWTWNDVCVSQVEENDGVIQFSIIFIPQEFYSVNYPEDDASTVTAVNGNDTLWSIIEDQPILTKLGFALIELAMGQTLEDMKVDSAEVQDRPLDSNTVNLFTAKRLLKSGKIRQEATREYEDAVRACIFHQYRGEGGVSKGLELTDDSFLENVREAVISPLFHVWKIYE